MALAVQVVKTSALNWLYISKGVIAVRILVVAYVHVRYPPMINNRGNEDARRVVRRAHTHVCRMQGSMIRPAAGHSGGSSYLSPAYVTHNGRV